MRSMPEGMSAQNCQKQRVRNNARIDAKWNTQIDCQKMYATKKLPDDASHKLCQQTMSDGDHSKKVSGICSYFEEHPIFDHLNERYGICKRVAPHTPATRGSKSVNISHAILSPPNEIRYNMVQCCIMGLNWIYNSDYVPQDPYMPYMVTFTINIPQMLAYIPYMDPKGVVRDENRLQRILKINYIEIPSRSKSRIYDLWATSQEAAGCTCQPLCFCTRRTRNPDTINRMSATLRSQWTGPWRQLCHQCL